MINAGALWRALLFAGRFLTRWPLPDPGMPTAAELGPEMGRAALFYPLIGLLLGAALAGLALLLKDAPTLAAAAVLLIFWVWSSGALHLDGLADCADAWVGGSAGSAGLLAGVSKGVSAPAWKSAGTNQSSGRSIRCSLPRWTSNFSGLLSSQARASSRALAMPRPRARLW